MSLVILKTKIKIPFTHGQLVQRSRLLEKINQGVQARHKLTIIAAPAGFGKSTVASMWAKQSSRHIAWLNLENSDNEISNFLAYVIASIRTDLPNFSNETFLALIGTSPPPGSNLLPDLVNEIAALEEEITLVLDDYHLIENQEIHDTISFLLAHQPKNLHLVISTRANPPLPIAQLRAKRRLTELRAEDLRFTFEEGRTFLNEVMNLGLTEEEIRLLEERTEGWGVGMLLAAQTLQGKSNKKEFISAFSGSQKFILEYLIEEVLKLQPENIRHFLLRTAFLNKFCSELCNEILGIKNSDEMIQTIIKSNLFVIPLDDQQRWYRYHHLFADLLSIYLEKEYTEKEICQLHMRASHWFQETANFEQAITYAISGKAYQQAAELVEQIVDRVIARGQVKTLLRWLGEIPEEIISSRPRLLMHQGWVVFLSGNVTAASKILHAGKSALVVLPEGEEKSLLHGRLSGMLATIIALTRDISCAISEAQEALKMLPEDDFIYRARAARAWGVCLTFQGNLADALEKLLFAKELALKGQNKFLASEILSQIATTRKHQGKLSQAQAAYAEVLGLYDNPEQATPACLGYIGLAEVALERNELAQAEAYLNTGIELCMKGNIGYALQPAHLIGGLLKCAQGNRAEALKIIEKGAALSRGGGGSLESILGLAWFQVRLHLLCGDIEKALAWAEGTVLPPNWSFKEMPLVLDEMHQSLLARAYLKNEDYVKVLEIYDRVCARAKEGGRLSRVAELNLFKAVALIEMREKGSALPVFEKSIQLAALEGNVRVFLEAGLSVLKLINLLDAKTKNSPFIQKLEATFNKQAGGETPISPLQDVLVEPLTEREMEVLRLMCEGYTNQHIADELIVSVNTVKKHTSNIYGKLGVRNRAQAVLRAGELNLI